MAFEPVAGWVPLASLGAYAEGYTSEEAAEIARFEAYRARVGLPSRLLTHHDRRHKLLNHTSDAAQKAAESPEAFRERDPASMSFESIDRRSF